MTTFGGNLKSLRTKNGLSQEALAELLGVNRTQVSSWEHDRYALPATATLFRLAKALGCLVEDLLTGLDEDYESVSRVRTARLVEKLVSVGSMREILIAAEAAGLTNFREGEADELSKTQERHTQLLTLTSGLTRAAGNAVIPTGLEQSLNEIIELYDHHLKQIPKSALDALRPKVVTLSFSDSSIPVGSDPRHAESDVKDTELAHLEAWRSLAERDQDLVRSFMDRLASVQRATAAYADAASRSRPKARRRSTKASSAG